MNIKLGDTSEIEDIFDVITIRITDVEFRISLNDDGQIEIVKNDGRISIMPVHSNKIKLT